MKKSFQVGDRVSFAGIKGIVDSILLSGNDGRHVWVVYDQGKGDYFTRDGKLYSAQTRPVLKRLVKKKKRKTREFWINVYPFRNSYYCHSSKSKADEKADPNRIECIHVREVL